MNKPLLKRAIKALGAVIPGYPTGKGVGLILDRNEKEVLANCRRAKVECEMLPCLKDRNYDGYLYIDSARKMRGL
jgi:hypothetical protein